MNRAMVIVERAVLTEEVVRMVKATLLVYGTTLKRVREVTAKTVRARGIVDEHFKTASHFALFATPESVEISDPGRFEAIFGEAWRDVFASGRALTAKRALEQLGLTPLQLAEECAKAHQRGLSLLVRSRVKFSTGKWRERILTFTQLLVYFHSTTSLLPFSYGY